MHQKGWDGMARDSGGARCVWRWGAVALSRMARYQDDEMARLRLWRRVVEKGGQKANQWRGAGGVQMYQNEWLWLFISRALLCGSGYGAGEWWWWW